MNQISVVIPSLGNIKVLKTFEFLNSGSLVPDEILLCVPTGTVLGFDLPPNCILVHCDKRSQVAQRAYGFSLAKCEYVLQLDDDTILEKNCLEFLLTTIKSLGNKAAVAPVILDIDTKESIYKSETGQSFFKFIYLYLINGEKQYRPGTVTLVGSSFGPSYSIGEKIKLNVEWLAGCCVLHRRENLNLNDYFVLKGKAYGEDLLATFFLKQKGIKFYIDCSAICLTPAAPKNSSSLKELIKDLRSKHYYLTLSGQLSLRFYIFYVLKIFKEIFYKLPSSLFNK